MIMIKICADMFCHHVEMIMYVLLFGIYYKVLMK